MGKLGWWTVAKEQRIYLEGMAFAVRVAKERGLAGLEEELAGVSKWRDRT